MKRRISRGERKAIREQLSQIKMEESIQEDQSSTDYRPDSDWKEAQRAAKKERRQSLEKASLKRDSIAAEDSPEEMTTIQRQYFFSEGDMVEWINPRNIVMEGDVEHSHRKIGLILETEDWIHEKYPSGKAKLITKCSMVTVLVGSAVEQWPSSKIKLIICE